MWEIITFIPLGIIAITAFWIYRVITMKAISKIDVKADAPMVENNYRQEFTNGYARGVVKMPILKNKNGTHRIEFYPTDVEQGEDVKRPHLQTFIINSDYKKHSSTGEISGRREIIRTLPRSADMIPENMRNTEEGKWETKEGQEAFLKSTFGQAIPNGDEAIAAQMKEWNRGNMAKSTIEQLKENANALAQMNKEDEKK